jgi:hypothetical protein
MDPKLQALIDAPLANPLRLNIPGGKESLPPKPRAKKEPSLSPAEKRARGILTTKELAERKALEAQAKLTQLYDYYATTDIPAERVAEHMGVYHQVQVGTTDDHKPIYERQLNIGLVRAELERRRK